MREYIKKQGLGVGPQHLEILVPAFDLAWKTVEQRGGFLLADHERQSLKDRLARAVVDRVMSGGDTDPERIAEAAVSSVLSGKGEHS